MASEPKKTKLDENGTSEDTPDGKQEELTSFSGFKMTKILSESSERKNVCVEGTFSGNRRSIVVLERLPLRAEILPHIFQESTKLRKELVNDIYGQYECIFPGDDANGIHSLKANVVLPATEKHVSKYADCASYIINETPQLYQFVTLPFIEGERFTIDWVYNILDHKKESERIIYEDPDPETGFIILPDFKWSGKQMEDLYLIGIVHSKNLKSIRSLRKQHLPLLKKLWRDGTDAISARYGVPRSQIRAYFHYQPSYYHLHVHYTHIQYNAPGITVDRAHLLPIVIQNIEQDSNHYSKALLPFVVKETCNLFKAYKDAGYDFDSVTAGKPEIPPLPLEFFRQLGRAKHEPCGEHWNVSYGDSAWRMAIVALCLKSPSEKLTVARIALSSAFTCLGQSTDQYSEWSSKMNEVRKCMASILPLEKASRLFQLYFQHVSCRRKACVTTECHKVYRQIMELEEALLLLEELQKEGSDTTEMQHLLIKKISEIPFEGVEGNHDNVHKAEVVYALLNFFLQISSLLLLKRTGWIRSKVRDPERVAGHMFRMALMSVLLEEEGENHLPDVTNSPMVISLVHDMAECIVGDITPSDPVSAEDKHRLEVEAIETLVNPLSLPLANLFKKAFNRYELAHPDDKAALLTKDLDKFDMVVQAFEYEEKEKRFGDLEDFFASTSNIFKNPIVKQWDSELRASRREKIRGKQTLFGNGGS